jgi:hypothetical protein
MANDLRQYLKAFLFAKEYLPQKLELESDIIKKENYQVVSKPSLANKAEVQIETR